MAKIQNRRTPPWFFEALQDFFEIKFRLDAAASKRDALCEIFYTKRSNGLTSGWLDWTFCNPEFKDTGLWVFKAWGEAMHRGVHSILLVPAGCTQRWLHDYARDYTIYAPDCRLSYNLPNGKPDPGADRDTMVLAFGPQFASHRLRPYEFQMRTLPVKHLRPKKKK